MAFFLSDKFWYSCNQQVLVAATSSFAVLVTALLHQYQMKVFYSINAGLYALSWPFHFESVNILMKRKTKMLHCMHFGILSNKS